MKLSLRSAWIVILLFLAALSAEAQSSNDLRAKYGSPMEAYEIRPHILMTVKYGEDAQVSEYVIEARHASKDGVWGDSLMSWETAHQIIDEIVPMSQRGRYINGFQITTGCNGVSNESYERVEIQTSHICKSSNGNSVASIIVRWKNRVDEKQ